MANISSNANIITLWETTNFSLRYKLDLTGHIISKIRFSPNGKDLLLLTNTSKLKYFRFENSQNTGTENIGKISQIQDIPSICDYNCLDFIISDNYKYIFSAGTDGLIKIFDYYMRGEIIPYYQAFMGHMLFPDKIILSKNNKYLFSFGKSNGIFVWDFYGDVRENYDTDLFAEKKLAIKSRGIHDEIEEEPIQPNLKPPEAIPYPNDLTRQPISHNLLDSIGKYEPSQTQEQHLQGAMNELKFDSGNLEREMLFEGLKDFNEKIEMKNQYSIKLKHIIGFNSESEKNIILNQNCEYPHFCYTFNNKIIIEHLNETHTQQILSKSTDIMSSLLLSPNKKILAGYNSKATSSGYASVYLYSYTPSPPSLYTFLTEISVSHTEISSISFNPSSQLLLISSLDSSLSPASTMLSVWDYANKELLAKTFVPTHIKDCMFNPYLKNQEFTTIAHNPPLSTHTQSSLFSFWRITPDLQLQYQEGCLPQQKQSERICCVSYTPPVQSLDSVVFILGMSTGDLCFVNTRSNAFMGEVAFGKGDVKEVFWGTNRASFILGESNAVFASDLSAFRLEFGCFFKFFLVFLGFRRKIWGRLWKIWRV